MQTVLEEFVTTLHPKALGQIKGTAKLVITDQGSVMLTPEGASAGDVLSHVTQHIFGKKNGGLVRP